MVCFVISYRSSGGDVRHQRDELTKASRTVLLEERDPMVIDNSNENLSDTHPEFRVKLREMVRDTVERIDVLSCTGRRQRFVKGKMKLTSGTVREFRFAYDVLRRGVVSCDGHGLDPRGKSKWVTNFEERLPLVLNVTSMNDEVRTELRKSKRRRPATTQPWTEERRKAFKPIAKKAAQARTKRAKGRLGRV